MSDVQPISPRRPRTFGIALTTSLLLAVAYGAGNWLAYDQSKSTHSRDFWHQVVLDRLNPFAGYLFGPRLDADAYVPWLLGVLISMIVVFVVVGIVCRAGAIAALTGAWLATSIGTTVGMVASTYVLYKGTNMTGSLTDTLAAAVPLGAQWGLLFGWVPGLLAAFFTLTLRKRTTSEYAPVPAAERTTSAYADLPD